MSVDEMANCFLQMSHKKKNKTYKDASKKILSERQREKKSFHHKTIAYVGE